MKTVMDSVHEQSFGFVGGHWCSWVVGFVVPRCGRWAPVVVVVSGIIVWWLWWLMEERKYVTCCDISMMFKLTREIT